MVVLGGLVGAIVVLGACTALGASTRRWVVGLAAAATLVGAGPSAVGWAAGNVQGWNLFHYTVGSRFFGELGYTDLYLGTLAVDAAGDHQFDHVTTLRDLHTYRKVDRAIASSAYTPTLTPERAATLRAVVAGLAPTLADREWRDVFVDRGYNATPAYTAVAGRVAEALPAEHAGTRWLSTLLDPLALALGLGAIGAAFGAEGAAWVILALAVFPGTEGRWFGAFLAYDWLAACAVGLAATRAERPALAAAAFAWATASRLFPAALVVSLLLPELRAAWRDRAVPPFARRFVPVYAAGLAVAAGVGCTTERGPAAWAEFAARFAFHSQQHVLGRQRIGLRHLLLGTTPERLREATADAQTWLWVGLAVVGLAAWAYTAARRSRSEAAVLGFVPVFLLAVSSRYYWAGFALVGATPGPARPAALGFLATAAVGVATAGLDDTARYVAIEAALAATLAVGLVAAAVAPPEPR